MSRIIESCYQCWARKRKDMKDNCMHLGDEPAIPNAMTIPDFCPLPKLGDKMREAWNASTHATGSDMNAYDEWRKQK